MKQKVDFSTALPKMPIYLPAKLILMILMSVVILLFFISMLLIVGQMRQYFIVKQIQKKNIAAVTEFKQLAEKYPLLAVRPAVIGDIPLLEKSLTLKKNTFAALNRTRERTGFSNYLVTLAQNVPAGLWFDEMTVNQETKHIALNGFTIDPSAVATFSFATAKSLANGL